MSTLEAELIAEVVRCATLLIVVYMLLRRR